MMAWKTMDVRARRVRFVVAASRGEVLLTALCQDLGISRPTGYAWLERYRKSGVDGIAERSRRPCCSPVHRPPTLETQVVAVRQR
jgi:transposase